MPQEMTTKNAIGSKLDEGKVRPNVTVTVYSTDVDKQHKTGDPMEVHPELAKKLVEAGKATFDEPKSKTAKKD